MVRTAQRQYADLETCEQLLTHFQRRQRDARPLAETIETPVPRNVRRNTRPTVTSDQASGGVVFNIRFVRRDFHLRQLSIVLKLQRVTNQMEQRLPQPLRIHTDLGRIANNFGTRLSFRDANVESPNHWLFDYEAPSELA